MKEKIIDFWESEKLQKFVKGNKDMLIKVTASALLVVVAFFVFAASDGDEKSMAQEKETVVETEASKPMIMVDIGGEVMSPMVAELEEGSRVEDAIKAAGGVTENADLTDINRAAFLEDGDKILIPSKLSQSGEDDSSSDTDKAYSYADNKVNINTADSTELQTLNGIGPVTAEKIIEYRTEQGMFKSIEDIKNVSGIGDKTFEKFKDDIRT